MSDGLVVESTESFGSRIIDSIKGILVGLVMFVVAFPILFLNEGRAVKRAKTLKEGAGSVVSVQDISKIDPAMNGKLVHVSGMLATADTLADKEFGVSVNAISLNRVVEMYQWKQESQTESKKQVGGSVKKVTTYSYKKEWSSEVIPSLEFKVKEEHVNPAAMKWSNQEWKATNVSLGAYKMPAFLLSSVSGTKAVEISDELVSKIAATLGNVHKSENYLYVGNDSANPMVGDIRIRFTEIPAGDVSLIAKQTSDTFERYTTSNGGNISILKNGIHSSESMFSAAVASNKSLTWILRLVGFVVMFIGFYLILKPIAVVADVLPFLGSMVAAGAGIASLAVAVCFSFITISIAWITYRPLIGIPLLVIGIGVPVFLKIKTGAKQETAEA